MNSRRLPQTGFLSMLFLSAVLLCVEVVHAQVVIEDTEFANPDWTATVLSVTGNTTHSAQQAAEGFPGTYRNMTHNMAGFGSITVFHEYQGPSFDPAVEGGIQWISYSESRANLDPAFQGAPISGGPALRQSTIVYTVEPDDFDNSDWATAERGPLDATDFSADDGSNPDFSASGAPIQLGYTRSNTAASGFDTEHGIDNWRFEICRTGDTDCDDDGVNDIQDNCRYAANPGQRDKDRDGIGNACDGDVSQDCSVNFQDLMVLATAFFTAPCDTNWHPDADINDDDIVNFLDSQIMAKEIFLNYRVDNPSLSLNDCTFSDDGDLIFDVDDNCTLLSNADQQDTNGDGFGNVCDPDLNNDCAVDAIDEALLQAAMFSTPGAPNWNPDADFDGNGVVNAFDLAVYAIFAGGPPGPSGVPNVCSLPDTDGDGVPDTEDNCTLLSNPDQRDSNDDGFGNVCDPDLNNDCVVDAIDEALLQAALFSTSCTGAWDPDADFNGDDVVNSIDLAVFSAFEAGPPGPALVRCPNDDPGASDFSSAKWEGHNATNKPVSQP